MDSGSGALVDYALLFSSDVRSAAVCVCFSSEPEVRCSLTGGVIFAASRACDTVISLTAAAAGPAIWIVMASKHNGSMRDCTFRQTFIFIPKYDLIYFQQSLPVSLPEFCENFFRGNTTKESMDRRLKHNHRRRGGNPESVCKLRLFNHQIFTFF